MIEGLKIVAAEEMARIEKIAYIAEGASEQLFVENAGKAIADAAARLAKNKTIHLLTGEGNNGADAFAAGIELLKRGFKVTAEPIFSQESFGPLCQIMYQRFCSQGGKIGKNEEKEALLIDGLVGTGFKGKAEGALAAAITFANDSGLPILAIDIPSGLNGTTGEVETVAIQATETLFLGLPKSGFFLKQGWDHVGRLRHGDFGLEKKYTAQASPLAVLLKEDTLSSEMPKIKRTRHKYEAGYVLAIAGSPSMAGAALLACSAALRSGAGIVRLFHPRGTDLGNAPYELIREEWDGKNLTPIQTQAERAKALLVGPGMGRTKEAEMALKAVLQHIALPMVIDADALFLLSENPSWTLPHTSILTPHRGEMKRLLGDAPTVELCQAFAEKKQVTIVLKGAPTWIFHPGATPLVITRGNPGMATAGSGDVLTGILASLLAQGLGSRRASAIGVYLHGTSGEAAAKELTPYCLTASRLMDFLPHAFKEL